MKGTAMNKKGCRGCEEKRNIRDGSEWEMMGY